MYCWPNGRSYVRLILIAVIALATLVPGLVIPQGEAGLDHGGDAPDLEEGEELTTQVSIRGKAPVRKLHRGDSPKTRYGASNSAANTNQEEESGGGVQDSAFLASKEATNNFRSEESDPLAAAHSENPEDTRPQIAAPVSHNRNGDTGTAESDTPSPFTQLWTGFKDWLGFGDHTAVSDGEDVVHNGEVSPERSGKKTAANADTSAGLPGELDESRTAVEGAERKSQRSGVGQKESDDSFETPPDGGEIRGSHEDLFEKTQDESDGDADEDGNIMPQEKDVVSNDGKSLQTSGVDALQSVASKEKLSETDIRMMVATLHKLFETLDRHILSRASLGIDENEIQTHHGSKAAVRSAHASEVEEGKYIDRVAKDVTELNAATKSDKEAEETAREDDVPSQRVRAMSGSDELGRGGQRARRKPSAQRQASILDSVTAWLDGSPRQPEAPRA